LGEIDPVSRFEKPEYFYNACPHAAPGEATVNSWVLLAALLAYAAGFALLYPIVASSVAKSVAQGNDPALIEFVAP
jgi:hypothetical protein